MKSRAPYRHSAYKKITTLKGLADEPTMSNKFNGTKYRMGLVLPIAINYIGIKKEIHYIVRKQKSTMLAENKNPLC